MVGGLSRSSKTPHSKKYCSLDREEILKRPPVGYSEDNPYIDLLKLKSYTASTPLTDQLLSAPGGLDTVLHAFRQMYSFKLFLHEALGED